MTFSRTPRSLALTSAAVLLAAALVGMLVSCKQLKKASDQKAAIDYNEKIVSFNKRIHDRAQALGEAIGKRLSDEKAVPDAELEKSLAAVLKELKDIRSELGRLKVPKHETAQALQKQYTVFLDGQDELGKMLGQAVALVTQPDAKGDRMQKLQAIIKNIEASEQKSLKELQDVQRKFATAHNITLQF